MSLAKRGLSSLPVCDCDNGELSESADSPCSEGLASSASSRARLVVERVIGESLCFMAELIDGMSADIPETRG